MLRISAVSVSRKTGGQKNDWGIRSNVLATFIRALNDFSPGTAATAKDVQRCKHRKLENVNLIGRRHMPLGRALSSCRCSGYLLILVIGKPDKSG
jgi:hypothetical protein